MPTVDFTLEDIKELLDTRFGVYDQELDKKLDRRFADYDVKMDQRFDALDVKLDKSFADYDVKMDKKFANHTAMMFSYMDKRFGGVDDRLDDLGNKFSDLQSSVDNFAGRVTTLEQEQVVGNHHSARQDRQISALAVRTGTKLPE